MIVDVKDDVYPAGPIATGGQTPLPQLAALGSVALDSIVIKTDESTAGDVGNAVRPGRNGWTKTAREYCKPSSRPSFWPFS